MSDPRALPAIEAWGLSKSFDGRAILSGVDLTVQEGEIVTLVGLNGSGKTTLVRIVLGLLKPDSGSVELRRGLRIGYMPQRLPADPVMPLTVRRFLMLDRRADPKLLSGVAEEVGVEHLLDSAFHDISGGEMQRVLLARALLRSPDLLVLDEPVQGVDVTGQSALYRLISAVRERRGCGVLMVSHELHLVMAATDRVICLNHHVCCAGRPEDVSRHPEYLALFGEQAVKGLAVYAHDHDHGHDAAGNVVPLRTSKRDRLH